MCCICIIHYYWFTQSISLLIHIRSMHLLHCISVPEFILMPVQIVTSWENLHTSIKNGTNAKLYNFQLSSMLRTNVHVWERRATVVIFAVNTWCNFAFCKCAFWTVVYIAYETDYCNIKYNGSEYIVPLLTAFWSRSRCIERVMCSYSLFYRMHSQGF